MASISKCPNPKYITGEIVYLSAARTSNKMPDKIFVRTVFRGVNDSQWKYECVTESSGGGRVTFLESEITKTRSSHTSPVYSKPDIISRMNDGWRFCGNYDNRFSAKAFGQTISNIPNIAGVCMYSALDCYGRPMPKEYAAVWVKYNHIISDDGSRYTPDPACIEIIK